MFLIQRVGSYLRLRVVFFFFFLHFCLSADDFVKKWHINLNLKHMKLQAE